MTVNTQILAPDEKAALEEIKYRVSMLCPVRQYILFGSKARGEAQPDSDIDLLIITKRPLTTGERNGISHEIFEVNIARDTNFSRIIVDTEEWENGMTSALPFHDNVLRDGIPV